MEHPRSSRCGEATLSSRRLVAVAGGYQHAGRLPPARDAAPFLRCAWQRPRACTNRQAWSVHCPIFEPLPRLVPRGHQNLNILWSEGRSNSEEKTVVSGNDCHGIGPSNRLDRARTTSQANTSGRTRQLRGSNVARKIKHGIRTPIARELPVQPAPKPRPMAKMTTPVRIACKTWSA